MDWILWTLSFWNSASNLNIKIQYHLISQLQYRHDNTSSTNQYQNIEEQNLKCNSLGVFGDVFQSELEFHLSKLHNKGLN